MSLYKRESTIRSPKWEEKRRKRKIAFLILFPIAVLSMLTAFVLLFRLPYLQIESVEIIGIENKEKIIDSVNLNLNGSYMGLIPKSSTVFYPKDKIVSNLLNNFKDIDGVSISYLSLHKLSVNIKSKIAKAVLCEGFQDDDNKRCFLLDKDGYIFSKYDEKSNAETGLSQYESSIKNLNRFFTSTVSDSDIIGTKFLDTTKLSDFDTLLQGISKIGVEPLGVLVNDGGQYELYVRYGKYSAKASSTPVTIYIDDKNPFSKILSNFLVFFKNYNNSAKNTESFDYIDMRFGNTVFYATKK